MRLAWAFQGGSSTGAPYPVPVDSIAAEVDGDVAADVTIEAVEATVTQQHPTVSFPDSLVVSIDEGKVTPDLVADV